MSTTPTAPRIETAAGGYRTTPDQENPGWPAGVPYIVGNEVCERFSFYGMRAILKGHLVALFTTCFYAQAVLSDDQVAREAEAAANSVTHLFFAGVYALPMIGAIIADRLLGKYRTVLYLSLIYCAGNAILAAFDKHLLGMYLGLALIAIGSGGIKPCVSANVGDQFGKANWHRVRFVYQIFYFSINFGSFFATILIPITKRVFNTSVAFGIPGILMFLATLIFWMGRRKFIHVPPKPGGKVGWLDTLSSTALFMAVGHFFFTPGLLKGQPLWVVLSVNAAVTLAFLLAGMWLFRKRQQLEPDDGFLAITLHAVSCFFSGPSKTAGQSDAPLAQSRFWGPAVERYGIAATEGPVAVFKIISVFFLVSIFWALFDQKATTWRTQAQQMDLSIWPGSEVKLQADQTIAANPCLVMLFIPLLNLVYRRLERWGIKVKPLPLMTVGMFITAASFGATAYLQTVIDRAGAGKVWIGAQLVQYVLLTIGEVMVSVTGLEFAYTQAPRRMKSTVMGFWSLTVSLGNVLVVFLAGFKDIETAQRFWIFAGMMAIAGLLFGLRAVFYVPRDYTQV